MRLVWTPRASHDQSAAIDYIAQDNPSAALDLLDQIEQQIELLIQFPEMGRPGRKRGTRELVISRTAFIVVYRNKARQIQIIRLLHGSLQWPQT